MPSPLAIASILASATSESCARFCSPRQTGGVSRTPNKMKKHPPVKRVAKFNTSCFATLCPF